MKPQENKVFRQEALERLSSPERLDQMMHVLKPRAWLPLTTSGSLIFIAVIWSIFGQIPVSVNGQGVLLSRLEQEVPTMSFPTEPDPKVTINTGVPRIESKDGNAQLVVAIYLPDKDGKQIKPGMAVQITPSMVKRERFGGIEGTVTEIRSSPVSKKDIAETIGNEDLANSIAQSLSTSGGAMIEVFASLAQDPNTPSGYNWSSSKGPPLELTSGTTAQVRVKLGQKTPISYVIPIFKSSTGLY